MGSNNISNARQVEAMKNLPADGSPEPADRLYRGDLTVLGRMSKQDAPLVETVMLPKGPRGGNVKAWKLTPAGIAKLNEKKAA